MEYEQEVKLTKLITRYKRNITALNKTIDEIRDVEPEAYVFFSGDSGGGVISACIMQKYSADHDSAVEQLTSEEVRNASCGAF